MQQVHGHLLRLPGGGAVADGDMLDAMPFDHGGKGVDAGSTLLFAVGGVNYRGIQYFPCGVHHRHLAAHPVAGVQPHGHLALHRWGHKERFQIQREIVNSPLGGSVCQRSTGLGLHTRLQKPVIAVGDGRTQEGFVFCTRTDHALGDLIQSKFPIQGKGNLQKSFLLTPIDSQDLMPLQAGYRLGEVIVQAINAVLFLYGLRAQTSAPLDSLPELLPVLSTVADLFGYDVRSAGQSVFDRADAFFFVKVGCCQRGRIFLRLKEDRHTQRLQPLFFRDGSSGAPLRAIGAIDVLQGRECLRLVDLGAQLRAQLVLLVDEAADLLPPLLQAAHVFQPLLQGAKGFVIHRPMGFLAVAGNEGNRIALVQEIDDVLYRLCGFVQFLRYAFCDAVHN